MASSQGHEVRERMLKDHERLEGILEQALAAFEQDDRQGVAATWGRFDAELLAHLDAEERFLIPALFRTNGRAARAILEEHRHIRARLTELGAGVDLHIVQLRTAQAFVEELRAHARHEDGALYRWGDEHAPETDRKSLVAALGAGPGAPPAAKVKRATPSVL